MFHSHIILAHALWQTIIKSGDTLVDATLGNGQDTLVLAKMLKGEGKLIGYDIQQEALLKTQKNLEENLTPFEKNITIELNLACHSQIEVKDPKIIVYNLGYLPGSDKSLTTHNHTTLQSIKRAEELIVSRGVISITLYPGHEAGLLEQEAVIAHIQSLSKKLWDIIWITWPNRIRGPSIVLCQKK